MALEGTDWDKKSLSELDKSNLDGLACDCVAFANAVGGSIKIGIEDADELPHPSQRIDDARLERIRKRIPQITVNVTISVQKEAAPNGGEFIHLRVPRSNGIASTSDGRYFIRVADETKRLMPDELQRLLNEKSAFIWEAQSVQRIPTDRADNHKRSDFIRLIRSSDRVSQFVRDKADIEILEHYVLVKDGMLTNLGVLWIGRQQDRATLVHAPSIQFLKYDETGAKVNKLVWDDFTKNPMELIESVWTEVPDWRETYELPDGLFRKHVPHFDEVVVRELLANALVHRPYTMRGDIYLNLYPDRLEVHNPGQLPLGVSPGNILHTTVQRNGLLAKVFYDLKLMEREGSGFDRMYEQLLSTGRPAPKVEEGDDRVVVTIHRRIMKREVIDFIGRADQAFQLTQKEKITLGLVAQHEALTLAELLSLLELKNAADVRPWLGRLTEWDIVKTRGRTRGTRYFVDPELLRKMEFKGRTTLRVIEPHRLKELILRDLQVYAVASIGEIHERIGPEIPRKELRRELKHLVAAGEIGVRGKLRWTRYLWIK